MPEAAANMEPQNNGLYREAATKVGQELLSSQSYAKLSESDLRKAGMMSPEETFTDYIAREMHFEESLQGAAISMFCQEAPPPLDTAEVNQWDGKEVFPREEEDETRLQYLGVTEEEGQEIANQKPEGLRRLVNGIVSSAAVYEWDDDSTADPEPFRKNIDTLMQLLDSEPELVTLNNQRCWAIRIPKNRDGSTGSILAAMMFPPSVGDYIVVGDPDRNAELSSLVFDDKELLGHMIKKKIRSVQSNARTELDNTFRTLSLEKYGKVKNETNEINNPARLGFFEKLKNDTDKQDVEVISIFRDRKDVEVMQGERPYNRDRTGTESGETRYTVTKGQNSELVFTWNGMETDFETVEKDGRKVRQMVSKPKVMNAMVREVDGHLEYAEPTPDGSVIEWLAEPDYNHNNADKVFNFFRNIELVTIEEVLEFGDKKTQPVPEMLKALNSCTSSVEFANMLREFGVAHYPSHEMIINPGHKVNYVVDSTTPPPAKTPMWN